MPPINDPDAVKFTNEQIRPLADRLDAIYYSCKSVKQRWDAQSMSSIITNTADLIEDGSQNDGRVQITGAQATNIITRAEELITDYEATNNAKLNSVILVSVNPGHYKLM